ncbi:MAG TPA: hypothetical protein DEP42_01510 [Ruminococcaceae bacterium]|nr:hypothetical protein [Oscillospiraceae bacterium]
MVLTIFVPNILCAGRWMDILYRPPLRLAAHKDKNAEYKYADLPLRMKSDRKFGRYYFSFKCYDMEKKKINQIYAFYKQNATFFNKENHCTYRVEELSPAKPKGFCKCEIKILAKPSLDNDDDNTPSTISDATNNTQAPTIDTQHDKEINMEKKIFISHSSLDRKIAEALVVFLQAHRIDPNDIFCSSIPGNGVGSNIPEDIHSALKSSQFNIILLSSAYYKSAYCQNEAGVIWFRDDVPCILFACPEVDETSMEGFLNSGYIVRRLDNNEDLAYLVDQLKEIFPHSNLSNEQVAHHANHLIEQYNAAIQASPISNKISCDLSGAQQTASVKADRNPDNKLEKQILDNEFSDIEMLILDCFYTTRRQALDINLSDLTSWLYEHAIYLTERTELKRAFQSFSDKGILYCDTYLATLVENSYHELLELGPLAIEKLSTCLQNKSFDIQKRVDELDSRITKGFTD